MPCRVPNSERRKQCRFGRCGGRKQPCTYVIPRFCSRTARACAMSSVARDEPLLVCLTGFCMPLYARWSSERIVGSQACRGLGRPGSSGDWPPNTLTCGEIPFTPADAQEVPVGKQAIPRTPFSAELLGNAGRSPTQCAKVNRIARLPQA